MNECELLAIILQSGTVDCSVIQLSQNLIEKYNGLKGVTNTDFNELIKNRGIGNAKATKIIALRQIIQILESNTDNENIIISNPIDIFNITNQIRNQKQEHLVVISLDSRAKVIGNDIIYIGSVDEITIHPREIFNIAIKKLATNIILVHNHPSGDVRPSAADIDATNRILEISNIIGIKMIDHIIVSSHHYYSIRENCDIIF